MAGVRALLSCRNAGCTQTNNADVVVVTALLAGGLPIAAPEYALCLLQALTIRSALQMEHPLRLSIMNL